MQGKNLFPHGAPHPRVLITAGPTAEDIDPVRFITNRSTGRMGLDLATAVLRAGGTPLLILGPTTLEPDPGIACLRVRSAMDMCEAVKTCLKWADSLVMAAAVADYTPAEPLDRKMKKQDGDLVLRLKRTPDILMTIRDMPERKGKFVVGFSLDVEVNLNEGARKMAQKNLDMIIVNTVASFGPTGGTVTAMSPEGNEDWGSVAKEDLAEKIVSRILDSLRSKQPEGNA